MTGGIWTWTWVVCGILGVVLLVGILQLKRCSANQLLLVWNRFSRVFGGEKVQVNTYHGGLHFVWPVIQGCRYLDLSPLTISLDFSSCTEQEVMEPTTFYFKVCFDVDSGAEIAGVGDRYWNVEREQIRSEIRQRIRDVVQEVMQEAGFPSINSERNAFLVELERRLHRYLSGSGFRLLTISHKS